MFQLGGSGQSAKPSIQPICQPVQTGGPILGICFEADPVQQMSQFNPAPQQKSMIIYLAHSDGSIKRWDPTQQQMSPASIGQHSMPVKDVYSFATPQGVFLVSGGWDGIVKFFKINGGMSTQIGESNVFKPVHYMSGQFPLLVTAHSEQFINIWNLDALNQTFNPVSVRESPLKYCTTAISCFGDGKGYAVGSIEGRCGIVHIRFENVEKEDEKDFCFKCHRVEDQKMLKAEVFSVNCITFNKSFNTFATVGGDGNFVVWNKDTKSRYKSSKQVDTMPMTRACFSDDGEFLVFAVGEDWSKGFGAAQQRQAQNKISICVRKC
mmetsp:Transcript_3342/g.5569  ORF Transcript_3342/g.5569 Transcript_3342/m.5569 type:complete len:322 (-) Transcript_3342:58-1023(-)